MNIYLPKHPDSFRYKVNPNRDEEYHCIMADPPMFNISAIPSHRIAPTMLIGKSQAEHFKKHLDQQLIQHFHRMKRKLKRSAITAPHSPSNR